MAAELVEAQARLPVGVPLMEAGAADISAQQRYRVQTAGLLNGVAVAVRVVRKITLPAPVQAELRQRAAAQAGTAVMTP